MRAPGANDGEGGEFMADIGFLGVTVVFFGLSWLLVRLCDRL